MELLVKAFHPGKRADKKKGKKKVKKGGLTVALTKTLGPGAIEVRTLPGDTNRHSHIALLDIDGGGDLIRGITLPDLTGHRHLITNFRKTGPADGKAGHHSHELPRSLEVSTKSGPLLVLGPEDKP